MPQNKILILFNFEHPKEKSFLSSKRVPFHENFNCKLFYKIKY